MRLPRRRELQRQRTAARAAADDDDVVTDSRSCGLLEVFPAALGRPKQFRNQAGPAGLMRRAQSASAVAVEIFVKQNVILEMRVRREFGMIF